jgi:hypothetical protein
LAGGIFMVTAAGIAHAQTTSSYTTTTTTVAPAPVLVAPVAPPPPPPMVEAPPPGTLAVTHTQRYLGTDGSQSERTETTYRNPAGVADESVTRTVAPPVQQTTTTRTSSTTTVIEQPPMPVSCPPHNRFDPVQQACVYK